MWGVLGVQGIRKKSQGVREGQKVRPAERASPASRQAGSRPHFPAPGRDRECQPVPRRLAGAASPVHVLFFKEVLRLSWTSGTKARPEPGLFGKCPRHLKLTPRPEPGCGPPGPRESAKVCGSVTLSRDLLETPPRGLPRDGASGSSPHSSAALAAQVPSPSGSQEPQPRSRRT